MRIFIFSEYSLDSEVSIRNDPDKGTKMIDFQTPQKEHIKANQQLELFPLALQELLTSLHREFDRERLLLLKQRDERQLRYDSGEVPTFETDHPAKHTSWIVAPIPFDLRDRRVEITGPISNPKMVINMLSENSEGEIACTAMLDFEDSMAPTWSNVISGIKNIIGVAHKNLSYIQNENGKEKNYQLTPERMALPMVRVRGLHLSEDHIIIDQQPISAGLFDLATTAFHTAHVFLKDGKTPKYYVPKCEHYLEARWWNKVFRAIETALDLRAGAMRTTFLIETLPAAFQMEEILYELRERACGLNGGRWDKIFSDIKTLKMHSDRVMANRSSIDMTRPWMDNYAKLLIQTCHKHGAFGMGGMSAFTPGKERSVKEQQIAKVTADKKREADIGHDGCWVSHPYFIGIAKAQFKRMNQLDVKLDDFPSTPNLLPDTSGPKTLDGLKQNLRVGIAYQQGWDQGHGCIAFENLMEDLATLEISRAQVWQWLHHKVTLDDGTKVTPELVSKLLETECAKIIADLGLQSNEQERTYIEAKNTIKKLFLAEELAPFFTTSSIKG